MFSIFSDPKKPLDEIKEFEQEILSQHKPREVNEDESIEKIPLSESFVNESNRIKELMIMNIAERTNLRNKIKEEMILNFSQKSFFSFFSKYIYFPSFLIRP